jgi:predicted nucleotidyltransferase
MKICAIVCEYNPFHTGHLYQISKASKKYDGVVCIMSGNFVQRAQPAIVEKYTRASVALNCGASMVIELPVIYSVATGEKFADGAIKTLSQLKDVNAIVMGAETDDKDTLIALAKIQYEENDLFSSTLKEFLNDGNSYASALCQATARCAKEQNIDEEKAKEILSTPNNLLCIEYIKAIYKYGLKVEIDIIKRIGASYNSLFPTDSYASATALRDLMQKGDFSGATPYLTGDAQRVINEYLAHKPNLELFSSICVYALRNAGTKGISLAYDCREGIENKLYENALLYDNIDDVLANTKSKRYTMARLRRIILQVLLGITKDNCELNENFPLRVLAIKEDFKPYLDKIKESSIIRTGDFEKFNENYDEYFEIERKSANLYSLITSNPTNLFYPSKLYTR